MVNATLVVSLHKKIKLIFKAPTVKTLPLKLMKQRVPSLGVNWHTLTEKAFI